MSDDETRVVIPKDMLTLDTDERGRAYFGTEYKDAKVRVAVLEVECDND